MTSHQDMHHADQGCHDFACTLCTKLGVEAAIHACQENMWYGVLSVINELHPGAGTTPPRAAD